MFRLTRDLVPRLDRAEDGTIIPFLLGPLHDVTAIPVQVGLVDRLAVAMTATTPGLGGDVVLSDHFVMRHLPPAGVVQIDNERVSYTSTDVANRLLRGITRGAQGTIKAEHAAGAIVSEVLELFVYVVCENPGVGAHRIKALHRVKLDGVVKEPSTPPVHTVNLQDRDLIPGIELVTITFDMTTLPPEKVAPKPAEIRRVIGLVLGAPTNKSESAAVVSPVRPPVPSPAGYGRRPVVIHRSFGSLGAAAFVAGTGSEQGVVLTGGGTGGGARTTYTWPAPALGTVTVDADGLQDDAAGTIAGISRGWLLRPAHQVRFLLREAWAERDDALYDLASFASTDAKQSALGLAWAQVYAGESFREWAAKVLLHGRADLFNESGRWTYRWRERGTPALVLDSDDLTGSATLSWTGGVDLTTILDLDYGFGQNLRRMTLTSTPGIARYGAQRGKSFALPWIPTEGSLNLGGSTAPVRQINAESMARSLGLYWLGQWERQRLQLTVPTRWATYVAELGDTMQLDDPLLDPYGRGHLAFRVVKLDDGLREGTCVLYGEEVEGPSITFDLQYRVQQAGSLAYALAYTVAVTIHRGAQPTHALEGGLDAEWTSGLNSYVG